MPKHLLMPEISIITPCYNSSKFLQETIQSVLNQTFQNWEWIIIDDERVIIVESAENGGAGHARNLSLEKAKGRFITFLDADDFWEATFLEEMIGLMKKDNSELAYSNYARCNESLEPQLADFVADTNVTFQNLLKTCRLSLLSSMYDSQRVGKEFFPVGTKREDHVMWLNLLKKIKVGKPLPKTLAKYRMHPTSVSRKKSNIIKDQYSVYKDFMQFSTLKSLYYTANWAINGFFKYSKLFN